MRRRGRVVHPTDFSRGADAGFVLALGAAKREGAGLILVHVVEPLWSGISDETNVAQRMRMRADALAAARKGFDRLRARATKAGVRASGVVAEGWPPEQIVKVAKSRGARLIVMGTHGRTGLRKALLGSVAERVVATAACPVLTVHVKG
jgi:nucleotide-binding universal stress UspA family protein